MVSSTKCTLKAFLTAVERTTLKHLQCPSCMYPRALRRILTQVHHRGWRALSSYQLRPSALGSSLTFCCWFSEASRAKQLFLLYTFSTLTRYKVNAELRIGPSCSSALQNYLLQYAKEYHLQFLKTSFLWRPFDHSLLWSQHLQSQQQSWHWLIFTESYPGFSRRPCCTLIRTVQAIASPAWASNAS